MRVISGVARGRKLKEPVGMNIRPTSDKIKESIFNIIQFDIEGRRVLDLFAGTGQLGIEALSRGAESVVFVDESNAAIRLVRENLKNAGLERENARVVRSTAQSFISGGEKFDIVILDPPYNTGDIGKILHKIMEIDILTENGIILCETQADTELPEPVPPYEKGREYRYGRVRISLYLRNGA
jgi:16S rRNA (guanine(966)-N(2))-methyltransferase RsmD